MSAKSREKPKSDLKESSGVGTSEQPESAESMAVKFEQELVWCIEQLQLGLETQNPTSRQAVEAEKALKILLSAKAPMIKKRQVMRNTFGDYRKKMAEMERKSSAAVKKGVISPAVSKNLQKSTFFKKSGSKSVDSGQTIPDGSDELKIKNQSTISDENSVAQSSDLSAGGDLNSSFQFSFKIDDSSTVDTVTTQPESSQDIEAMDNVTDKEGETIQFRKSDNTFRFNFSQPS